VHGVRVDGRTAAWLSWEIDAVDGAAKVRLIHDDADLGCAPEPELDRVLAILETRCARDAAGR
jgi:hypothetical protein